MNPVIQINNLSVCLKSKVVIDGFSAELGPRDFVALVGCNGSGKTTLLRAVMGFVRPSGGEISLFGSRVSSKAAAKERRRIAYVPQTPALDFRMPITVIDIVGMGRYAERGIGRSLSKEDRDAVRSSMSAAGISHLAERPIGHLSGGERQKAQIARALCQAPDILLLDEPTSNLDLGAQHECLELIGDIHDRGGLTIMIVMHDLQALPRNCNRAIIIDDGKKFFDGRFKDIFTRENLSHIYKHRAESVMMKLLASAPDPDHCTNKAEGFV